ncbi:MAG: Asp-tRNA(Asn)/Glu-tRNA(Gln) amidotransferase subunit GatC [bacterium]
MITIEEVRKIAGLAKLKLASQEEKRHAKTISCVLDYMKILDELDLYNIEQTSQVTGLQDVMREDKSRKCDYAGELIKQMPEILDKKLKVPNVFSNQI